MVCAELWICRMGCCGCCFRHLLYNLCRQPPVATPITSHSFFTRSFSCLIWLQRSVGHGSSQYSYVNLGAVLLYKLSQKHFNQTADHLFYVSLICYRRIFHVHLPLPLIAAVAGSLKGRSSRDLLKKISWLESYLAWTCWSVQRRLSWLPLGCARGNWKALSQLRWRSRRRAFFVFA